MAGSKAYMPWRLNFSRKGDCGMCGRGTVPNEVGDQMSVPSIRKIHAYAKLCFRPLVIGEPICPDKRLRAE